MDRLAEVRGLASSLPIGGGDILADGEWSQASPSQPVPARVGCSCMHRKISVGPLAWRLGGRMRCLADPASVDPLLLYAAVGGGGGCMLMRTKLASVMKKLGHPRMWSDSVFALASYFERGTFGRGSERLALPLVVTCRG